MLAKVKTQKLREKKPLSKKIQELKEGTLSSGQISEQLKTFISTCKDEQLHKILRLE